MVYKVAKYQGGYAVLKQSKITTTRWDFADRIGVRIWQTEAEALSKIVDGVYIYA